MSCHNSSDSYTETHPFNDPLSQTTRVSRYQEGKTNLDFTEARDSEWQWHQQGHMHVCTSLQTDNHASTPPLKFFTGQTPFLLPNQQRQSTEGVLHNNNNNSLPHSVRLSDTFSSFRQDLTTHLFKAAFSTPGRKLQCFRTNSDVTNGNF